MKVGEWDGIGRARGLIVRHLGELGAAELATHVTITPDSGKARILVATDTGLLDYSWAPNSGEPDARWTLRGSAMRWASVRGLRLQTDGEWDPVSEEARSIWRLVAEDPRMELAARSEDGERGIEALLAFARACLQQAG